MRKPPALATSLLLRLGAEDDALAGDLFEEFSRGRSRTWYWRQVLASILMGPVRLVRSSPVRAFAGVVVGWVTLLVVFSALGDRTANGLAGWLWNWDRQTAYATGAWGPFRVAACLVSYSGFALSALAVVRLQRRDAGPALVCYAASVAAGLTASAVVIDILSRLHGGVPVPHPIFYIISVALPYHWRSGVLLAPLVILFAGLSTGLLTRPSPPSPASEEELRRT